MVTQKSSRRAFLRDFLPKSAIAVSTPFWFLNGGFFYPTAQLGVLNSMLLRPFTCLSLEEGERQGQSVAAKKKIEEQWLYIATDKKSFWVDAAYGQTEKGAKTSVELLKSAAKNFSHAGKINEMLLYHTHPGKWWEYDYKSRLSCLSDLFGYKMPDIGQTECFELQYCLPHEYDIFALTEAQENLTNDGFSLGKGGLLTSTGVTLFSLSPELRKEYSKLESTIEKLNLIGDITVQAEVKGWKSGSLSNALEIFDENGMDVDYSRNLVKESDLY